MDALLVLENGKIYHGQAIGAAGEITGEVVFNTSMTGYQEILTDPSYAGQLITMTYPLIGNYGYNLDDLESKRIYAQGLIVRELCETPSNWRAVGRMQEFLRKHQVLGIAGIDTRDLTQTLRSKGTMRGLLTTRIDLTETELVAKVQRAPNLSGFDFPRTVTTPEPVVIKGQGPKVVLIDFGVKTNIVRWLVRLGCEVVIVPCWTTAAEILHYQPDGLVLSNGPGDPTDVPYAIKTIQKLLGTLPIFGICLGHQLLGLACGAKTYKLKFGHRGANHPVKDLQNGRIYITSQNHGFAIDENSLAGLGLVVTHRNLNDGTVEGIRHQTLPAFSVQYHPEAAPGPQDSAELFKRFWAMLTA